MTVIIPAGNWQKVDNPPEVGGVPAILICPTCRQWGSLARTHRVDTDGTVHNSVICGYKCGFHDWVKLEGWTP
jgi:hypothetical protein